MNARFVPPAQRTGKVRDAQRARVYATDRKFMAVEAAAGKDKLSIRAAQQLADRIWDDMGGARALGPHPEVVLTHGRAACYRPSRHQVRLSARCLNWTILLHEMAHALLYRRSDIAWHGPEFVAVYATLMQRYHPHGFSAEYVLGSFAANGASFTPGAIYAN